MTETGADDKAAQAAQRRVIELFRYLVATFQSMLPPEKAEPFGRIAEELETAVEQNFAGLGGPAKPAQDPRRNRFLLRLVVSRVSHLFSGAHPKMPKSLIELDRYLKKAFGPIIYGELNAEANSILEDLNLDDDRALWEAIRRDPPIRRFVDTVFIRILFRFENFTNGKKIFINVLAQTMEEISKAQFGEDQFLQVFEAMFSHLWPETKNEEQRLRWDFMFGDGTSQKITTVLTLGLKRWLKREAGAKMLSEGATAAKNRASAASDAEQTPYSVRDR